MWGVNNGMLDAEVYAPVALKGWKYLSEVALQSDGSVGYVQPIGERAIPGQVVSEKSTADFGVGAFCLLHARWRAIIINRLYNISQS